MGAHPVTQFRFSSCRFHNTLDLYKVKIDLDQTKFVGGWEGVVTIVRDQVQHWFKQLHQLWQKVTRTIFGKVWNTTLPREMGQMRPHLVTWEGFWCPHKLYNGCLLIKVLMPCFTLQWVAPNETFYWSLLSFSFHPKSVRIDLPY